MDTDKLIAALDQAIAKDRPPEEKIFLRLLREVWQIDFTIPPYEIWSRMIDFDLPYFLRFMSIDNGDENQEHQLIDDWIRMRSALQRLTIMSSGLRMRMTVLMDEVNRLRVSAR
jgi:hypothetical protein